MMSAGNETRRPTEGSGPVLRCEEARVMIMGYIDDELGPAEVRRLEDHLAVCVLCRREAKSFRKLAEVTDEMVHEELPVLDMEVAWETIYRRLERSTGWLLMSAGLILLLAYGAWEMLLGFFLSSDVPVIVKLGTGAVVAGAVVLLVSIGRETLTKYRGERYREVNR
jgi:anti-sigma factor RsiW